MDLIHKIESLRYDIENGVVTDVISISVRLIQIKDQALQLQQTGVIKSVCDRVNNFENNRCINCGAKAGHKCELQTVL